MILIKLTTLALAALLMTAPPQDKKQPQLDDTGFIVDDGLIMVKANCTSCHSNKIIIQNRADADGWVAIIRTMQKKNGLWQMAPSIEKQVVAYLARNYAPQEQGRRRPLTVPEAWLNKSKKP